MIDDTDRKERFDRILEAVFQKKGNRGLAGGFVDDSGRAATPHLVDCHGLSRQTLVGVGEFERELHERLAWCEQNASGVYAIEPIGPDPERLTGRRFRFADQGTAALFRMWFSTDLAV